MTKQELYLKTMFCCMVCDGDIAKEEIDMVKDIAIQTPFLKDMDVEKVLNTYVSDINQNGALFLRRYLNEISEEELTQEELHIINLAIRMIEADNRIEYSEVKFFKKIRSRLSSVSDEQILAQHPDKEYFLSPDIDVMEEPIWNDNIIFANINLK